MILVKKKMSAYSAFLYIAKAWDKPKPAYVGKGVYGVRIIKHHKDMALEICWCVWFLDINKYLFPRTSKKMIRLFNDYKEQKGIGSCQLCFPTNKAGAKKRAALCRELANKCK